MQSFKKRIVKHSLRDRFLSEEVLKYISIKERFVLSSVCKLWNEICQDPSIFKNADLTFDFGDHEVPMQFFYSEDDFEHQIDCSALSLLQMQSILSVCKNLEYGIYIIEEENIPDLPLLPNINYLYLETPIEEKHLARLRELCMKINQLGLGFDGSFDPLFDFLPKLNLVSFLVNCGNHDLTNLSGKCPALIGLSIADPHNLLDDKVITRNISNLMIAIDFPTDFSIPSIPSPLPSIKMLFLEVKVNIDESSEVVERAKTWINDLINACENLEHVYICQEVDRPDEDFFEDQFKYISPEDICLPLTIVEDFDRMENLFVASCRKESF